MADRRADGALPGRGAAAGQGRGVGRAGPGRRGRQRRRPARGLLLHRLRDARAWTSCSPATWACRPTRGGSSSATWAATPRCPGWASPPTTSRSTAGRPSLLCVELTSLHVQPPTVDPQQVVAHALFSDAAAAVVLVPGSASGRRVREVAVADRHHDGRPHDLARDRPRLPDGPVAAGARRAVAPRRAARHRPARPARARPSPTWTAGRCTRAARGSSTWSQEQLGLPTRRLAPSRAGLAEHGNCSSPTVLLILDQLLASGRRTGGAGPVVLMAFGPGLTLYAALLLA